MKPPWALVIFPREVGRVRRPHETILPGDHRSRASRSRSKRQNASHHLRSQDTIGEGGQRDDRMEVEKDLVKGF